MAASLNDFRCLDSMGWQSEPSFGAEVWLGGLLEWKVRMKTRGWCLEYGYIYMYMYNHIYICIYIVLFWMSPEFMVVEWGTSNSLSGKSDGMGFIWDNIIFHVWWKYLVGQWPETSQLGGVQFFQYICYSYLGGSQLEGHLFSRLSHCSPLWLQLWTHSSPKKGGVKIRGLRWRFFMARWRRADQKLEPEGFPCFMGNHWGSSWTFSIWCVSRLLDGLLGVAGGLSMDFLYLWNGSTQPSFPICISPGSLFSTIFVMAISTELFFLGWLAGPSPVMVGEWQPGFATLLSL